MITVRKESHVTTKKHAVSERWVRYASSVSDHLLLFCRHLAVVDIEMCDRIVVFIVERLPAYGKQL